VRDGVLHLATLQSDGRTVWDATPARLWTLPAWARAVGAQLGDGGRLEGVAPAEPRCATPCRLDLTLFWRAERPLLANLSVFLHLVTAEGRLVAQSDGPPDGGRRPLPSWLVGEVVADRHLLTVSLPPGEYRLLAGLYDPVSGQRFSGPAGDAVDLGVLRVEG